MGIYHDILKKYWGYADFRDLQEDIIQSVCEGRDTLALMPTGGGKSITFQVPALAMDGICLVVTPLIALMKDQVENLKSRGIKAAAIYSGMTQKEILITLDNCLYGDYKFLYVSPERLSTETFVSRIKFMQVNLIAVDESHCISQWGYDFRPSYLNIAEIRDILPGVPVLALTATATPEVVKDIQQRLHFPKPNVFQKSFERSNLAYVVRHVEDKEKMLLKILDKTPGSAVVYVRSRKNTKEISDMLHSNGISSDYFHAGLTNERKDQKQAAWMSGECRVIVATNAFGMGIDKADVRLVVHIDLPDSMEAYFQEAGRAGRDGEKAYAVLLFQKADATKLKKRIHDSFPEKETIRKVYESLAHYFEIAAGSGAGFMHAFDLTDFCTKFKYSFLQGYHALKILEQAGYIELTEELDNPSRVYFLTKRDELYQLRLEDKKSDEILQTLLRSYTGLFADFVPIQEEVLAKRLQTNARDIYERLLRLSKLGVIHYIPRKKSPYIIYQVNREDTERVILRREVYEDRLERYEKRIGAMLDYANQDQVCRSKQLLLYFGQKDAPNCGKCDVCLTKNEMGLSRFEYERIQDQIFIHLSNGPMLLDELIDSLQEESAKSLKVFRHLCDAGKIRHHPDKNTFFL
ncbi:MAG: ATP-dependent DNA helicase RecQ [Bacteroidales bacterium]|nr:ATP-dependent DNA helicase RecQ [Bacteroidales bacterium]